MHMESGDYTNAPHGSAGASGAYQFITSTWKSSTSDYGVGTQYANACDAPPGVQNQVAADVVASILRKNGNSVEIVPLVWYTGNAQGTISAAALAENHGLQPSTYQANWMSYYNNLPAAVATPAKGYADLGAAAYWMGQLIGNDARFQGIKAALMNNASARDFSAAVVQSDWSASHYGVAAAGASGRSAITGRDLDYLATVRTPPDVTAPLSHGANISGTNGNGCASKVETAYYKADRAIQQVLDLLAA